MDNHNWQGHWATKVMRWGQVNLQEQDPLAMDVNWWKDYWRRTRIDGITVNAGGIVTYYPSELDLQTKSPYLGARDLFGELVTAAKEIGLRVVARLDVSQADRRFYYSHPDWFTTDKDGKPYQHEQGRPYGHAQTSPGIWGVPKPDLYVTCPNGPYYWEFTPQVIREVLTKYGVDGFFDNGWPALRRIEGVCYCPNCRDKFRAYADMPLPKEENWQDPVWRKFVEWKYQALEDVWRMFNEVCFEVNPESFWLGNLHDEVGAAHSSTNRLKLTSMCPMTGSDHQGRSHGVPIWDNGANGKFMRSCSEGKPYFNLAGVFYAFRPGLLRIGTGPDAEQRLWMSEASASGTRPWWHCIGGVRDDMRWTGVVEKFYQWHAQQDEYFRVQDGLANIAMLYSPRSYDFYGKKDPMNRCKVPYNGYYHALVNARIPFDVVHERKLSADDLKQYDLLILPNVGAMSDEVAENIRAFVKRGGNLVATFETSLYDEWGDRRRNYALADVLGVDSTGPAIGPLEHSAMRVVAPHEVLAGFAGTDLLPNTNASLCQARANGDAVQPLKLVPPFSIYPPEMTYPRVKQVDTPLLFLSEHGESRVAYLAEDLDRIYYNMQIPDLGLLLESMVRWAVRDEMPVKVSGPGLVDVHVYRGDGNIQVHLVNLTNPAMWMSPASEITPVGEQTVEIRLPSGLRCTGAKLLMADQNAPLTLDGDRVTVTVPQVLDYEVVVAALA